MKQKYYLENREKIIENNSKNYHKNKLEMGKLQSD